MSLRLSSVISTGQLQTRTHTRWTRIAELTIQMQSTGADRGETYMNATRRERGKRPPISRSWQLPHPPPRTYADLHTSTYIYTHTHRTCRRTQAPSLDIRLQDPIPSIHPILLHHQSPTSRGEHQSPNQPTHTQPTREPPTNVSPTQFSHLPHLPHISHPNVTPATKHPMLSQISSSEPSQLT